MVKMINKKQSLLFSGTAKIVKISFTYSQRRKGSNSNTGFQFFSLSVQQSLMKSSMDNRVALPQRLQSQTNASYCVVDFRDFYFYSFHDSEHCRILNGPNDSAPTAIRNRNHFCKNTFSNFGAHFKRLAVPYLQI